MLTHLSLSDGQWPLPINREDSSLKLVPLKPDYPYNKVLEWAEISQEPEQLAGLQPMNDLKIPDETKSSDDIFDDWVNDQIRNDTDTQMQGLQDVYVLLALDEAENKEIEQNFYKYVMSVILRFLLDFYRIFKRISFQSKAPHMIDMYGTSFDEVDTMKAKRNYSHLQIAAPVRGVADMYKSIIYETVQIIQTKCSTTGADWECVIMYLAELISDSINCPNVWYYALVHLVTIDNTDLKNQFLNTIANLLKLTDAPFQNMFDYVMKTVVQYKEFGRVKLSSDAILYSFLADVQENGLLNCGYINDLYF
ncbi:uncharacterized protein [Epargyreus clarus]|uniref:uncharacterized protein n=1 Tax=Epargyreus clarus TaxID=520877 RepID=UPI003C2E7BEB